MKNREKLIGCLCAAFTIIVWGSTFISSKKLLTLFSPAQIMLTRFLLAYGALWLVRPKMLSVPRSFPQRSKQAPWLRTRI